ncbi:transglutaminase family protein [Prochlorococcus marinus]|uniref:transglutaminase family protein n=1 Tax=Prochlorococcus marinus TaxID=1219 RepID=UPI001C573273|nr:transglutaminase family protein [Prochlorococcus marinus]MBW3042342.1 transglutaminase family protein [Prochlorococcus marinus str. XMU1408]
MKKKIIHKLVYTYETCVSLDEHLICLKPRSNNFQKLNNFQLKIFPSSHSVFPLISENGDDMFKVFFTGDTNSLTINAESDIETKFHPDLCYLKNNYDLSLPLKIESNTSLTGFVKGWFPNGQHDPAAIKIAQEALAGTKNNILDFLDQLIELIKERVKYTPRHLGPAWTSGRTLSERVGSCRDLAILLMETCRCVGIPSRFVSGYQFMDQPPEKYELHAWTEVFIPGFGWRGFDPSSCGLINHNYVSIASSSSKSELVAPVRGSFFGPSNLKSKLEWSIEII